MAGNKTRSDFFEDSSKMGDRMKRSSPSFPDLRMSSTVTEFDRKVFQLRNGILAARESLSKSQLCLVETGPNTLRSSMTIDPNGAVPLPPKLSGLQTNTKCIGTNTEACLVIPYHDLPSLVIPSGWRKFLTCPTLLKSQDQEWIERLSRAHEFFNYDLPPQRTPITFTKISETDLDTSEDTSNGLGIDVYVEDENEDTETCIATEDGEYQFSSWTALGDKTSSSSTCSSTLTLSHALPFLIFPKFKTQSMMNLNSETNQLTPHVGGSTTNNEDRARSMELLLQDSRKNAHLRAPENTLMLRQQENRQPSEHELRIQKSLNKLDVPDWYRKYSVGSGGDGKSPSGSIQKDFVGGLAGGWTGLSSSKTSSLTSLQSTGRYAGSGRLNSNRLLATGTSSAGGRCGDSFRSPNSTASVSPSPYNERSSFTYGMPYAMTRFGSARMSCGASPASLSPSPSPVGGVGSSTSTPTAAGPSTRHHYYNKQPYLGWRSQERLASKTLYRTPSERLAADLLKSHSAPKPDTAPPSVTDSEKSSLANLEISPRRETASDLSLNNSEESNSHKLNRVRSSIKEVSNAIVDYVNESRPTLDYGVNGRVSPRRGFVWLESSFVGTKPMDSPTTPDTPVLLLPKKPNETKKILFPAEPKDMKSNSASTSSSAVPNQPPNTFGSNSSVPQPIFSRNEQMEERLSNSSSVSSPTLDDILDSLLALRRPHKKFRSSTNPMVLRDKGHVPTPSMTTNFPPPMTSSLSPVINNTISASCSSRMSISSSPSRTIGKIESSFLTNPSATVNIGILSSSGDRSPLPLPISPISDWQLRMNQPLLDAVSQVTTEEDGYLLASSGGGGVEDPFQPTNLEYHHHQDEMLLGLPCDPTRTFNTSPEANNGLQIGDGGGITPIPYEETDDSFHIDEHHPFSLVSTGRAHPYVTGSVGLTGLGDSSVPSSPAKHRRVSFDLDFEDREDKSGPRSRKDSDSLGQTVIHCRNSKCGKTGIGLEARREFKTCHNCNVYYCSRECRRAHWEKHKKVCMQSRVGALCKQIIAQVRDDSEIVIHLSRISRQGYLAKGRGCVKLFFSSPDRAERFLTGGFPELPEPWYIATGDILPEEMGAQVYSELSDQCYSYNTENRFVLYVSLCVVNEVPTSGAVKWEREMIARSAKIRLLLPHSIEEESPHHQASSSSHLPTEDYFHDPAPPFPTDEFLPPKPGEGETLILRSVPIPSRQLTPNEQRRMREVSFTNIQGHLKQRGVELRRTYPEIYTRLIAYVERDEPFLPVTIYPRNTVTDKQFTCVIMPESSDVPSTTLQGAINQIIDISNSPNINNRK